MEVVSLLRDVHPRCRRTRLIEALDALASVPSYPPPLAQTVLYRLVEVVKTYATVKLKPEAAPADSGGYASEAIAERALSKTTTSTGCPTNI